MIGSVGAAALLLIGVLLPSAYGLLAGYQIQSLEARPSAWRASRRRSSCKKPSCFRRRVWKSWRASSSSSIRSPQKVVYLDSKDGSSLALNQKH